MAVPPKALLACHGVTDGAKNAMLSVPAQFYNR